ncbi:MAG: hypothetical protein BGO43_10125 [Gammaproteobacteria bacterium 39-13]|nr:hypothetical protein [Gammaproteobacteria bacterium]OJV89113.1 MAG: hypothetical protein BGO43_10125 [Gammaproteobacteria bacterium 39-13]
MRDFNAFIDRLENVLEKANFPADLLKCISKKNLNAIIKRIIQDETLAEKIQDLRPYEALRLVKEKSKLARTLCIVRAPDGEFRLILETKSKTAANKKRKVTLFEGAFKSGKPGWRIDGIEPYVSMHIELASKARKVDLYSKPIEKQVDKLQKEIAFPWDCTDNPFLHRSVLGARYTNKKGSYISVYSPKGIPLNETKKLNLTQKEKEIVALQILQGLNLMHQKDYIYQDIKTENILVFKDSKGVFAKFNDFGFVTGNDYRYGLAGTAGYESPEVAFANRQDRPSPSEYYTKHYKANGKSLGKKAGDELYAKIKNDGTKKLAALKKEYKEPHPANDVWGCGILLYELFHDKEPKTYPKEKHFACLLERDRKKRVTAKEALELWRRTFPSAAIKAAMRDTKPAQHEANNKPLLFQYARVCQESHASWIASVQATVRHLCNNAYTFLSEQINYYGAPLLSYFWPQPQISDAKKPLRITEQPKRTMQPKRAELDRTMRHVRVKA